VNSATAPLQFHDAEEFAEAQQVTGEADIPERKNGPMSDEEYAQCRTRVCGSQISIQTHKPSLAYMDTG
jgi:hypothetical protein